MVLDVVIYPDERLETECAPIEEVIESIQQLAKDMIETMYAHDGIGLAANQVGHMIRMLVVDISEDQDSAMTLVNPKIIDSKGQCSIKEGCLSFPEQEVEIIRAEEVWVEAINFEGHAFRLVGKGLAAIVLQHEIDHLDGITMEARAAMQEIKE